MGKSLTGQESAAPMSMLSDAEQRMGVAEHLAKLVRRPEALPKVLRSSRMVRSSDVSV